MTIGVILGAYIRQPITFVIRPKQAPVKVVNTEPAPTTDIPRSEQFENLLNFTIKGVKQ